MRRGYFYENMSLEPPSWKKNEVCKKILFWGHKLAMFSNNVNILNLTVLIDIHTKNYKTTHVTLN